MKTLRLAAKGLAHSPRRTLLTAAGLANAVIGGLVFYGFTRDTYWGLSEVFARGGNGHVQIADAAWFDAPAPDLHRVDRTKLEAVRAAIAADPALAADVRASAIRRNFMGMFVVDGRSGVFVGQGTEPAAEAVIAPLAHPSAGRPLAADQPDGIVIGAPLAARLGVAPGGVVTALVTTDAGLTNGRDFTVSGLATTGAEELDRTLATFPLESTLALTDGVTADVLVLALDDTAHTDRVVAGVRRLLAAPALAGLAARPWYDGAHYYQAVHALYDRIFGVFEALMALVTVLSLSHAVAAVVAERRAEIAMLRVVGLRRRDVTLLFLTEGALLGALGCALGAVGAVGVGWAVSAFGGIPMPPPPGFTMSYAAQIRLDALGFAIVLPVTFLAAVAASAFPAWRATRGELSRGLVGLVALFVVAAVATPAHAGPLDGAFGPAIAADQRCLVDVAVHDGATTLGWRIATHGAETLAVTTTLPAGRRQAVLQADGATWFQTEGMHAALRVGLAQRVLGQLSVADVVDPRLLAGWEVAAVPTVGAGGGATYSATARPGAGLAFARAELDLSDGRLTAARFMGPSGAIVRTAHYRYDAGVLTEVEVVDAARPSHPTLLSLGRPACGPATEVPVTSDTLLSRALALIGAP